jgi:hypothetical protein
MTVVSQCKVATLLSPSTVAFNCGSNQHVRIGDSVKIQRRTEIFDPDTKESLGSVLTKVVGLSVTLVMEKSCVATVTDAAPRTVSATPARRPRLMVTTEPALASPGTVLISIGQLATIERTEEEPF